MALVEVELGRGRLPRRIEEARRNNVMKLAAEGMSPLEIAHRMEGQITADGVRRLMLRERKKAAKLVASGEAPAALENLPELDADVASANNGQGIELFQKEAYSTIDRVEAAAWERFRRTGLVLPDDPELSPEQLLEAVNKAPDIHSGGQTAASLLKIILQCADMRMTYKGTRAKTNNGGVSKGITIKNIIIERPTQPNPPMIDVTPNE